MHERPDLALYVASEHQFHRMGIQEVLSLQVMVKFMAAIKADLLTKEPEVGALTGTDANPDLTAHAAVSEACLRSSKKAVVRA